MKQTVFALALAACALPAGAQQFMVIQTDDGRAVISAADVERVTYEADADFHARLLPRAIAADPRTQLFAQALEATALADSLMPYDDTTYPVMTQRERFFSFYTGNPWDWNELQEVRRISFTAFVETDDVLAAHGISSLADLSAYAHRVYDEVFPEDATVADPTDRRHALNRFVAYHLLDRGSTYDQLTANPGFFDRTLADVADWYQTMLPQGTLKVARPNGSEEGLYLNRRGVQERADKYGVKVRGARIVAAPDGQLTQVVSNGVYYYLDDLIAFDRQTRDVVLNERWRIDFTTLSPDLMTSGLRNQDWAKRLGDGGFYAVATPAFLGDRLKGFHFKDDCVWCVTMENYHNYYWCFGGQEVRVHVASTPEGQYDLTVDLPTPPAGDYELRFGVTPMYDLCKGLFHVNGVQLGDTVTLASDQREVTWNALGWQRGLPRDEQLAADRQLRQNGWMRGPGEWRCCTLGQNSGQEVATEENSRPLSDFAGCVRRILGRFHSDGRTPLRLRIQSIPYQSPPDEVHRSPDICDRPIPLDYIELCPTWIADNEEVPEDL